jgi:hypothetical protein
LRRRLRRRRRLALLLLQGYIEGNSLAPEVVELRGHKLLAHALELRPRLRVLACEHPAGSGAIELGRAEECARGALVPHDAPRALVPPRVHLVPFEGLPLVLILQVHLGRPAAEDSNKELGEPSGQDVLIVICTAEVGTVRGCSPWMQSVDTVGGHDTRGEER